MKYYLYISDAKVDMLLPQVPHNIDKKIGMEVGFDFKLFSAKRKVESETERDRVTRLEKVLSFIEEFGNVGSMEAPDDYISDTVPMKFGPIAQPSETFGGISYFLAQSEATTLGLFGSAIHMIGSTGGESGKVFHGSAVNHIFSYHHGDESRSRHLPLGSVPCSGNDRTRTALRIRGQEAASRFCEQLL